MTSQTSITGLLVAALMFTVTVAMHEAASAGNRLSLKRAAPVADTFVGHRGRSGTAQLKSTAPATAKVAKPHSKTPAGFKAPGGPSKWEENCHYDNDGIVRCDDCDVDWDEHPPTTICIKNAICHDGTNNGTVIPCP